MSNTVEQYEHAGLTVRICWEEDGSFADPRDNCNLGTMVCWHPDYILGDEQIAANRGAVKRDRHGSANTMFQTETGRTDFRSMEQIERYLRLARKATAIVPLTLYDHSGISIRASAHPGPWDPGGWDSTMVGFIYTTAERMTELCGAPDYVPESEDMEPEAWRRKQLVGEVEEYNLFLTGQVYYFVIEDEDGETLDSCGGFLGDEYVKEAANEAAEACADERERRKRATAEGWALAHQREEQ